MACRSLVRRSTPSNILCLRTSRITCHARLFSIAQRSLVDDPTQSPLASQASSISPTGPPATSQQSTLNKKSVIETLSAVGDSLGGARSRPLSGYGLISAYNKINSSTGESKRLGDDEHHLHVFSTKHNTHLTFADCDRKAIISISAGNLGFRKSQRGTYDAAYQLMSYLLSRIQQQGLMSKIRKLELCFRGFGQGREAVTKVLMGTEGTRLREAVVRIVDKTRLKIGGNRSPAPRRLG